MMEQELRQLLKERGWNLHVRTRGKRTYYYAQKWRAGEVYIAPEARLAQLTREEVLKKISA